MADMMNRQGMGGGMMNRGMQPPGGGNPIKDNMSIFNPTDALLKGKSGEVNPQQTIREFMQVNLGLDVDKNTMMDLQAKVGEQAQKANPMNKMRNIARPGMPPGAPGVGAPPPPVTPPPGGGTLEDLMG